jgi:RHH-type transcriptional regulator, proline utilization regulon repressor / proline dehydrogenase / delta 1-pyrroline-5-carboxylate dehydrogenase
MRYFAAPLTADPLYIALNNDRFAGETLLVGRLLGALALSERERGAILDRARGWVRALRAKPGHTALDTFLTDYALDSRQGVALLCLAEAALRVPDPQTLDALIRDKLGGTDWRRPCVRDASLFAMLPPGRSY